MMTIQELAAYKVPVKGVASRQARMDAITVLQWTGRILHVTVKAWDNGKAEPAITAADIHGFMTLLEQATRNHAGTVLTEGQRAEVEQAAHAAARVAGEPEVRKELKEKEFGDA